MLLRNEVRQEPRVLLAEDRIIPLELQREFLADRDVLVYRVNALLRDINLAHLTFPG